MTEISNTHYVDDKGIHLPWYTETCLNWLLEQDFKGKYVFEYGMGLSTTWYKSQGAICFGVESNPDWYASNESPLTMLTTDRKRYTEFILNFSDFDFVIVDGLYRDDCVEMGLRKLKKGGYLIMDNWLQPEVEPEWPKTAELIRGLQQGKDYFIFSQPGKPTWKTLVLKR